MSIPTSITGMATIRRTRAGRDAVRDNLFGDDTRIVSYHEATQTPSASNLTLALHSDTGIAIYSNAYGTAARQRAFFALDGIIDRRDAIGTPYLLSGQVSVSGSVNAAIALARLTRSGGTASFEIVSTPTTLSRGTTQPLAMTYVKQTANETLALMVYPYSTSMSYVCVEIDQLKVEDGTGLTAPTPWKRQRNTLAYRATGRNLLTDGDCFAAIANRQIWDVALATTLKDGYRSGIPALRMDPSATGTWLRQTVTGLTAGRAYCLSFQVRLTSADVSLGGTITGATSSVPGYLGLYYDGVTGQVVTIKSFTSSGRTLTWGGTDDEWPTMEWQQVKVVFVAAATEAVIAIANTAATTSQTAVCDVAMLKVEAGEYPTATVIQSLQDGRDLLDTATQRDIDVQQLDAATVLAGQSLLSGASSAIFVPASGSVAQPTGITVSSAGTVGIDGSVTRSVTIDADAIAEGEVVRMIVSGCVSGSEQPEAHYIGDLGRTKGQRAEHIDYFEHDPETLPIADIIAAHRTATRGVVRIAATGRRLFGAGCVMEQLANWDPAYPDYTQETFKAFDAASEIYVSDGIVELQKIGGELNIVRRSTFDFMPVFDAPRSADGFVNVTFDVFRSGSSFSANVQSGLVIPVYLYDQRIQWVVAQRIE